MYTLYSRRSILVIVAVVVADCSHIKFTFLSDAGLRNRTKTCTYKLSVDIYLRVNMTVLHTFRVLILTCSQISHCLSLIKCCSFIITYVHSGLHARGLCDTTIQAVFRSVRRHGLCMLHMHGGVLPQSKTDKKFTDFCAEAPALVSVPLIYQL